MTSLVVARALLFVTGALAYLVYEYRRKWIAAERIAKVQEKRGTMDLTQMSLYGPRK